MLRDEPELAHLRLEFGRANDRDDVVRDRDHLDDALAHLGRREVVAHPAAQVFGLADVEHPATFVAKQVDARKVRHRVGQMPFAALLWGDHAGERAQLVEGVHPEAAEPFEQHVQDVDGGTRVVECAVRRLHGGMQHAGQRRQLAVGCLVAGQHAASEPGGVDGVEAGPPEIEARAGGLQEAQVERSVVRDEHAVAGELEERRKDRVDARRGGHHGVRDAGEHGDEGRDRLARIDEGLEFADDLAAANLHGADLGDAGRRR